MKNFNVSQRVNSLDLQYGLHKSLVFQCAKDFKEVKVKVS